MTDKNGAREMPRFDERQEKIASEIMKEYLTAPGDDGGKSRHQETLDFDAKRAVVIRDKLLPLLTSFLAGTEPLPRFKTAVDGLNKRNEYWGFKGIKGQMFFNMVTKVADDLDECASELRAAIAVPGDEAAASSRIKTFASYVKRLGEQWVEQGNTRHGCPKPGSIPYFLSYFWQLQAPDIWPVYYTQNVQALSDLNLFEPGNDLAKAYLNFKHTVEALRDLYTHNGGQPRDLYFVEHTLWNQRKKTDEDRRNGGGKKEPTRLEKLERLPESYVPPVVAVLPSMARHDEALVRAAGASGTSLERAFEKHINLAFNVMQFETELKGQGCGRVPDGLAHAPDDNYTLLWDAKIRRDGYSMGTDDRTIREYITTQSREIKRRRTLRNIYYVIISSRFADDFDDAIRSIKMETDISEVVLLEAKALVAAVDAKLRAPLQVTLGPDGIQRLFSSSGVVTEGTVQQYIIG